ncbi:EscE/YscE/SsaE family type III secretion system needle protein co-chaperone [Candidatus Sororendozoicomonas aggregata]|uniref:EscE/YscE/SsaE family type III secretion system needle protein co-chaperone n=1 Tax=Candidatus Sororendozoicomonas aggregata TaxID=3073239 RepID=UPI002ED5AEBB
MTKPSPDREPLQISDLETRLIHDKDGYFRDQLLQELFDEMIRLKKLRVEGASPEEYQRIDSIVLGISSAGETVSRTWKAHHERTSPIK